MDEQVTEVIAATSATADGEATFHISRVPPAGSATRLHVVWQLTISSGAQSDLAFVRSKIGQNYVIVFRKANIVYTIG